VQRDDTIHQRSNENSQKTHIKKASQSQAFDSLAVSYMECSLSIYSL